MSEEIKVDVKLKENQPVPDTEQNRANNIYSVDVMDTMFADSLSRGMQNAIISQQNAQMASSASITTACARILQAATDKAVIENTEKKSDDNEIGEQIEISIETKSDCSDEPDKARDRAWYSFLNITPWLLIIVTFVAFVIAVSYLQAELEATNLAIEQQLESKGVDDNEKNKEEK